MISALLSPSRSATAIDLGSNQLITPGSGASWRASVHWPPTSVNTSSPLTISTCPSPSRSATTTGSWRKGYQLVVEYQLRGLGAVSAASLTPVAASTMNVTVQVLPRSASLPVAAAQPASVSREPSPSRSK